MSETLAEGATNVRYLLRDRNPDNYAVSTPEIYRSLIRNAEKLARDTSQGTEWQESLFTLSVGSLADYTLDTVYQYQAILELRIYETGITLNKASFAEINAMREGLTSTSSAGDPSFFAIWEDESQRVRVRVNCVPSQSRRIDGLVKRVVAENYDSGTNLPFSAEFLRIVEESAALELAMKMPQAEAERIQLNLAILPHWQESVRVGVLRENQRKARLIRRGQWVGSGRR